MKIDCRKSYIIDVNKVIFICDLIRLGYLKNVDGEGIWENVSFDEISI